MTIAEQLTKLNDAKTGIKNAIEAKGVTVGDAPLAEYADKISQISGGGGGAQFGFTPANIVGVVDENGSLEAPSAPFILDLTGVKTIKENALYYTFSQSSTVTGVKAPDLTRIENQGMQYLFSDATAVGEVVMPKLSYIGTNGARGAFSGSSITKLLLPGLAEIGSYGCVALLSGCPNVVEVDFSGLMKLGNYAFQSAFASITTLTSISFPALYSVETKAFGGASSSYAFNRNTGLREIHFAKAAQPQIEATTGYADKWGATNAEIFFDL